MAEVIGIFGGTFDPIHKGHLRLARDLCDTNITDRLHLVVGGTPPHRPPPIASPEQRLTMARLALPDSSRIVVDDRELQRGGHSYTIDTLRDFRKQYGPQASLALALGEDAFAGLADWRDARLFQDLAHIIVVPRADAGTQAGFLNMPVVSSAEELKTAPAGYIWRAPSAVSPLSSTQIRAQIHTGQSLQGLLPDPVVHYLKETGLYRKGAEAALRTSN